MTRTVYRNCNLCEAMCGLKLEVEGERIVSVRPDEDDVFCKGHICPKGVPVAEVHHDPGRLRTPMRRTPCGDYEPISWEDAFNLVASRLLGLRERHGADAIAT